MEKEQIIWILDFLKIYTAQNKDIRNKLRELLDSIDKEVDNTQN